MFFKRIDSRIKIVLLIFVLLFIFIILRVFYVQVFDYNKLSKLANGLWSRELPIQADRGLILDRNGIVLADNVTTTSLVLIPNQIKDKEKTTKVLAKILNVSYKQMKKHVNKKTSIERVHPEGRRLSYDTANKINNANLKGVYLVKESKRNYPYKNLLSHVLGYVGIDNQGLSGIELEYDDMLTGTNGAIKYYADAKGNKLKLSDIYEAPSNGMNIQLTVDYNIQSTIEREMNNIVKMFNPDMALAIAMDPNTGEILGMGSRPDYDPNNYKKYSIEQLSRNLPIWASYEPGSTFKIITTASAINEGKVDLEKDRFYDSGSVTIGGAKIKCWKAGGHGEQTFLQVLENSCNPGFVRLGNLLGKETLYDYIDKFGFGEKTGVDLNGEGKGIIFNLKDVHDLELATTAFGQGVSVTPIQQVTAVSAVVNGGALYQPYIVKNILDAATNSVIEEKTPTVTRKNIISKETSDTMRYALESVVARGGGRSAYIEGYRVGGKTGTAQKVENGQYLVNNYIMSFMSIVPANNPEVVFYLAIDNPKNTALLSSYTTTPIARRILLDIIDALNIKKQSGAIKKVYEWNDDIYIKVPNVIGMNLEQAKKKLKEFEIIVEGKGNKVIHSTPSGGEMIPKGATIRLMTSD